MLAKRIIPCLDVSGGSVVKGIQFENVKALADPVTLGAYYAASGADELVYYDITASTESRGMTEALIAKIAAEINIPFTVGGGVRTLEDFYTVLGAGADKVSINASALKTPELITAAAKRFGSQCVVVSMDVRQVGEGLWKIYTKGGREATDLCPIEWAKQAEALGAGELVINAIHADGMRQGYDLSLTRRIAKSVGIPIVASGGAGCITDFAAAFTTGKADAALAASIFHNKQIDIAQLKNTLSQLGIPMNLPL